MPSDRPFRLEDFMPYLLNRAAEGASRGFQRHYRDRHGMLRTEWRVLYHLGRFGALTATEICRMADLHKTKVSRAVAALERRRLLSRARREDDRRHEALTLTPRGRAVFDELVEEAERYEARLLTGFSQAEQALVRRFLKQLGAG